VEGLMHKKASACIHVKKNRKANLPGQHSMVIGTKPDLEYQLFAQFAVCWHSTNHHTQQVLESIPV